MRKFFCALMLAIVGLALFSSTTLAQSEPYIINNFHADIAINQDTSLIVVETLEVLFREPRHGIFRYVPVIYKNSTKTINSRLQVQSVVDQNGKKHKYKVGRSGDFVEIKIGDPDRFVQGTVIYKITYRVRNIIERYDGYDELYWNVAGDGWDTVINSTTAQVKSDFARVDGIQCFQGSVGVSDDKCEVLEYEDSKAQFVAGTKLGQGRDMTIVVALNPDSQLNFNKTIVDYIYDYWGYPLAVIPFIIIFFFWYKLGRDKRYTGDNIYYEPTDKTTKDVNIFGKREFLPMVYSPINGLTPAEVGTLVDERIDIHDVVAEIVELGRLGFLKIEKIDKKLAKDDYLITGVKTDTSKLRDYQKYLFDSIFGYADDKDQVKISELKTKFYTKLETFRNKLYDEMQKKGYFLARPDKVRIIWLVAACILYGLGFFGAIVFSENTGKLLPLLILALTALPGLMLAFNMPRRTPKGYSLYRQIKGLAFYLKKGQWRHEVNEKHLFLEEMLPLAVSLGVVSQLARDMDELGVKPPSYFNANSVAWAGAFNSFNSSASTSFTAGSSSKGSWSGGSGFSGGSSGGGFGGGGGGSW